MNNIYDLIPKNIEAELFDTLLDSNNVKIERIVSKGHSSPETGWYDQDKNEWVLVLNGEASLLFADNTTVDLKAGDFINIPAHKKHQVQWTNPDIETIWLAIHY